MKQKVGKNQELQTVFSSTHNLAQLSLAEIPISYLFGKLYLL